MRQTAPTLLFCLSFYRELQRWSGGNNVTGAPPVCLHYTLCIVVIIILQTAHRTTLPLQMDTEELHENCRQ